MLGFPCLQCFLTVHHAPSAVHAALHLCPDPQKGERQPTASALALWWVKRWLTEEGGGLRWQRPDSHAQMVNDSATTVFLGCSDADPHPPPKQVRQSCAPSLPNTAAQRVPQSSVYRAVLKEPFFVKDHLPFFFPSHPMGRTVRCAGAVHALCTTFAQDHTQAA